MAEKTQDEIVVADLSFPDIFYRMPGHVYLKDKNGVYIASNDRDEFGSASDGTSTGSELVGKTDYDFPWKEQAEVLQRNDKEVMESGKTKVFIELGMLKSGKMSTFCSIKAPLRDKKGNIIGVIGHSTDISDVKNQIK